MMTSLDLHIHSQPTAMHTMHPYELGHEKLATLEWQRQDTELCCVEGVCTMDACRRYVPVPTLGFKPICHKSAQRPASAHSGGARLAYLGCFITV
jgi:hypothetical protein